MLSMGHFLTIIHFLNNFCLFRICFFLSQFWKIKFVKKIVDFIWIFKFIVIHIICYVKNVSFPLFVISDFFSSDCQMVVNFISPSTKPFWSWWSLLLFLWFLFNNILLCCYCFLFLVYPVPHLSSWIRCLISLLITTLKNIDILWVPFAWHPTRLLHDASWFTVLSIFWVIWGCCALTHELVEAFSHQSLTEDPSASVSCLFWCLAGFPLLCPSPISPLALYLSIYPLWV